MVMRVMLARVSICIAYFEVTSKLWKIVYILDGLVYNGDFSVFLLPDYIITFVFVFSQLMCQAVQVFRLFTEFG